MKKKWLVLIGLSLIIIASGCGKATYSRAPEEPGVMNSQVAERPAVDEGERFLAADADQTLSTATQDRMIIFTVNMEVVVKDTAEAMAQIESLADEMGGFVSDSSSWKDEGQLRARVTLRVPAESLDEALTKIRGLALDVESEDRNSQDVTEEFTDLDAQLRNRQAYEEELLELLKIRREATSDTEAILEVYRELTRIRSEIDQIQGRMNYLSNLSAMATIHVTLTPDVLAQPLTVGKWQPQGTALQAIQALINTLTFLGDALIIILLYVVPVLIIILLPLFLIVRGLLRWRRKRRQPIA
jgi:Rad3-related DNA helicase